MLDVAPIRHPAAYSDALLPVLAEMLAGARRILDPFAGTGKVHRLGALVGAATVGVEIEPEWAGMHPQTMVGSALALDFPAAAFDAVVTSPCYGNRMADHHNARDTSKRNTYRHALGRALAADNAGALQWGEQYRGFHLRAWAEARRVLQSGGVFVLNISDHIRRGQCVAVTDWHIETLEGMGFVVIEHRHIETPRQRFGANGALRVGYESVIKFNCKGANDGTHIFRDCTAAR